MVLSARTNLKVPNSLLVRAKGGAVGGIYLFTHRLYGLLTSAENSLPSLQYPCNHCIHQQSCSSKDERGESLFPWRSCLPAAHAHALALQSGFFSPWCSQTRGAHGLHTEFVWKQWKQPPNEQKFLEECTGQLSTRMQLPMTEHARAVIQYEMCSAGVSVGSFSLFGF